MKSSIKTLSAALVLFGTIGSANATVTAGDVFSSVQGALGSGSNINVTLDGDVATLHGYFEDTYTRNAAIKAAKDAGAERVINRAIPNS